MDLIIIITILFIITTMCCFAQAVMYSSSFRQKNSVMKLDRNTKEWKEFEALFRDNKINNEGYIVIFPENNGEEELMLHFDCIGTEQDYFKNNCKLIEAYFQHSGYNKEGDPGRYASYDLIIDNIVSVTEIEEGGTYLNSDDYNSYSVNCLLKDGRTFELDFSYKEV